jgi:alpha-ketoglutarate-dependent taurine dioxygenase
MRLDEARRELDARGFVQAHLGAMTDEELTELALRFGRIAVEPRDPRPVRAVSPSTEGNARQNTLSSRYGFGAFPFHTDTAYWRDPASLLFLYCVDPGAGSRQTLISDAWSWALPAAEQSLLRRSLWRVDRKHGTFLTRLASRTHAGLNLRYDAHCMKAIGSASVAAAAVIQERAAPHAVAVTWATGDMLIIDNRRTLHARTVATQPDPERTLKRILVHAHE